MALIEESVPSLGTQASTPAGSRKGSPAQACGRGRLRTQA